MPQKRRTTAASSSAGGKKKKGVEIPQAAGNQGKVSNEVTNTIDELCDATASTSSGTISNSTGPQPLRSFCDSLGLHLNQAVKVRIQKGEFIELGSLLTPPGSAPPSMSFALVKEGQKLVLGQQVDKSPSIGSIEEWAIPFEIHTPPVEDFGIPTKISVLGHSRSKQFSKKLCKKGVEVFGIPTKINS